MCIIHKMIDKCTPVAKDFAQWLLFKMPYLLLVIFQ